MPLRFFPLCIFPYFLLCCCSSLSHDFATPWTAAHQAFLSFTISQSLLKLMSIELMLSSNYLILCLPLLTLPSIFPRIRVFSSESGPHIRWPKYWSFSFSISPSNEYQGWFPLGMTGLISLLSKGLSRVFFSTTAQRHHFFSTQPGPTLISIHDYWENHSFDYMNFCWQSNVSAFKTLSRPVITPLQYSCLENPMDGGAGRLQSMGSQRVGHNWATSLSLFTFMHWRRKWQPTPVFFPGESQGLRSLVGSHRVRHDWSDLAAAAAARLVITFLPRSKHLLISWLQSPSAVILDPKKIVCHCFHCFPIYLPWSNGTRCCDLCFWMLSVKPAFSLSFFTFIKRFFNFSSFFCH